MSSYFIWSYNYTNGRRAIQGDFVSSEEDAKKTAARLSEVKGRTIVLRAVIRKYKGSNLYGNNYIEVARYSKGKMMRY